MVKVRMQGTEREIRKLLGILERMNGFRLENISDFFNNKGTDRYKRMYMEVHLAETQKVPYKNRPKRHVDMGA